jgi:hypothetical protein
MTITLIVIHLNGMILFTYVVNFTKYGEGNVLAVLEFFPG